MCVFFEIYDNNSYFFLYKRQDQIQDNEFALLKKQANNYQEEMKTLNQNMNISVNKVFFVFVFKILKS